LGGVCSSKKFALIVESVTIEVERRIRWVKRVETPRQFPEIIHQVAIGIRQMGIRTDEVFLKIRELIDIGVQHRVARIVQVEAVGGLPGVRHSVAIGVGLCVRSLRDDQQEYRSRGGNRDESESTTGQGSLQLSFGCEPLVSARRGYLELFLNIGIRFEILNLLSGMMRAFEAAGGAGDAWFAKSSGKLGIVEVSR
jgi:hypothetical protein